MAVMTRPVPTTSQSDIDLIVHANHWDPFSVLGLHELPADAGGAEERGSSGRSCRRRERPGSST